MLDTNFAKFLTLNPTALKDLSLDDVLELHPLLDTSDLTYEVARKTKPIKARPINTILSKSDDDVLSKLLLSTLEGSQDIKRDSFICWGVDNDVWQQSETKLHNKYTPVSVDVDGWAVYAPKPDVDCDACVITSGLWPHYGPHNGFSIINPQWGDARVLDSKKVYLHYGVVGDVVIRVQDDHSDVYRVARKFFDSTYDWA